MTLGMVSGVCPADPKREVPDYDGRGNPDADAGSWVLWIPRVMLSPLYLTSEYLLRRPLGAFVSHAERERWADTVVQLFTFGEGGKNLIVPTALFDFGLLPSVGFYYSAEDVFADDNHLRVHAATWGEPWINAIAADRYVIDPANSVQLRLEFKRSEDNLFVGIGPAVTSATQSRYGLERSEVAASYRRQLGDASRLDVESGIHRIGFVEGECCHDPSLAALIAGGQVMAPPGYGAAYTAAFGRAELVLDTRAPAPAPGGGLFLHAQARPSADLHGGRSWIRYGGMLGGALDLTGHRRTLSLQVMLDFVDPITGTGDRIPFTEYAVLGGDRMPGFLTGWMTGRSTAAAQLGYTWPVWLALDAQARLTVGNAFGAHLDGLAARQLRVSGDLGFATGTIGDQGFEILFGLGTETFEQGGAVTSVRVTVGARGGIW